MSAVNNGDHFEEGNLSDLSERAAKLFEIACDGIRERAQSATSENNEDWVSLRILRGLAHKASEDFQGVVELAVQTRVGPAYSIARSLLETAIDLVYLTPDASAMRRQRAASYVVYADLEERRTGLLLRREEVLHRKGRCLALEDSDMSLPAARSLLRRLRTEGDRLADVAAIAAECVCTLRSAKPEKRRISTIARTLRPGVRTRMLRIRDDGHVDHRTYNNLVFAYLVVYQVASGFVHTTGSLALTGDESAVLSWRDEPLKTALLLAPDILRRLEDLLSLGLGNNVQAFAEQCGWMLHVLSGVTCAASPIGTHGVWLGQSKATR